MYLFHFSKPVLPIEMEMQPDTNHQTNQVNIDKYVEKMTDIKKKLYSTAHDEIEKAQKRQEKDYNRKRAFTTVRFYMYSPEHSNTIIIIIYTCHPFFPIGTTAWNPNTCEKQCQRLQKG